MPVDYHGSCLGSAVRTHLQETALDPVDDNLVKEADTLDLAAADMEQPALVQMVLLLLHALETEEGFGKARCCHYSL